LCATTFEKLRQIGAMIEQVSKQDLETLRRADAARRARMWAEIERVRDEFEGECLKGGLARDIENDIRGDLAFARLLLTAAAVKNNEPSPPGAVFTPVELKLLEDFEKYRFLDIVESFEIARRMARSVERLHKLVNGFLAEQYSREELIFDAEGISGDLRTAFSKRHKNRIRKVEEAVALYIREHGLSALSLTPGVDGRNRIQIVAVDSVVQIRGNIGSGHDAASIRAENSVVSVKGKDEADANQSRS